MKLAYLAHTPIPSNIASSIHVMRMCQAFSNVGHDVTLVCPKFRSRPSKACDPFNFYGVNQNFQIDWLPRHKSIRGRLFGHHRMVRRGVTSDRFDLAYVRCHCIDQYRLENLNVPIVIELHVLHERDKVERLLRSPWVKGLVFISEGLRAEYDELLQQYTHKTFVLARDGADEAAECRPRDLPGTNQFRCGYIGNLYQGKGAELMAPLASRCPNVDFHVFGGQENEVALLREKEEVRKCKNLFYHGFIEPGRTEEARAACDILVAPYQPKVFVSGGKISAVNWMSPLKLFEYMASGKTVLTSDLPVLKEFMRDGENAILLPPQEIDAWVAAINWTQTHREEADQIAQNGKREFLERYSWNARARMLSEEFGPSRLDGTCGIPSQQSSHTQFKGAERNGGASSDLEASAA